MKSEKQWYSQVKAQRIEIVIQPGLANRLRKATQAMNLKSIKPKYWPVKYIPLPKKFPSTKL